MQSKSNTITSSWVDPMWRLMVVNGEFWSKINILFFLILWLTCFIGLPITDVSCTNGHTWLMHGIFAGILFATWIWESYIFYKLYACPKPKNRFGYSSIPIIYFLQTFVSVLTKVDTYTDLAFILIAKQCGNNLWIPSLIVFCIGIVPLILVNFFVSIFYFLSSTRILKRFTQTTTALELVAINAIMDYNIFCMPVVDEILRKDKPRYFLQNKVEDGLKDIKMIVIGEEENEEKEEQKDEEKAEKVEKQKEDQDKHENTIIVEKHEKQTKEIEKNQDKGEIDGKIEESKLGFNNGDNVEIDGKYPSYSAHQDLIVALVRQRWLSWCVPFFKFIFEDIGQAVIQLLYIGREKDSPSSTFVTLSVALSISLSYMGALKTIGHCRAFRVYFANRFGWKVENTYYD